MESSPFLPEPVFTRLRAPGDYRAVLFDLDGTLVDNFVAIAECCALAMEAVGQAPADYDRVRRTVGGSIAITMERLVGDKLSERAAKVFRQAFAERWRHGLVLLPGARELLLRLHAEGRSCAVLTNKEGARAREICRHFRLDGLLAGVVGEGDAHGRKPMPEFTRHALALVGQPADRCCLIGDSPFDITTAGQVDMDCYTVATGTHTLAELRAVPHEGAFPDLPTLGRAVFGGDPPVS